jgi:hypothetical protein
MIKKINHYKNNYPSELSRSGKSYKKKINIFFVYGYFFFIYLINFHYLKFLFFICLNKC